MKKSFKFPDTLIILFVILVIFTAFTWIIPAGEFQRQEIDGRLVVIPGSYSGVNASPQGFGDLFMAPVKGFIGAAQIIAFVLFVGGAFSIMRKTGAIDAGLQRLILVSSRNPSVKRWVIPIIMTLFSLCGASFGMSEELLVFVLISIPLAISLGYDSIVGVAISFVAAGAGFAGAFMNPFTIGVAQGIAELAPFSGMGYRIIVWFIMTLATIIFVMRYARKIEKNPASSLMPESMKPIKMEQAGSLEFLEFTSRRKYVLLLLFLSLALLILGVASFDWYINEIAALFIAMGLLAGLIGGLNKDEIVEAFKEGTSEMLVAALVIAMAKGLIVIISDGMVIDTLLNAVANATDGLPRELSVAMMFVLQSALNFFMPSGSGQAALTMPIMAPLSDLLGISRQVAVLAFQFGDGLSNMIIPTSGVTMGILSISGIPYEKWLKWMMPLFLILSLLALILLILPVSFFQWT